MKWTVHGERSIYESPWLSARLTDIEIPAVGDRPAHRFEHHVVRFPMPAAGVVVHDDRPGIGPAVLLLWRHRFITDVWGWEVPAGRVDPGEDPEHAAGREVLEETGWRPGPLTHLTSYSPASGVSDHRFELFAAEGAEYVGEPSDPTEAERIEWVGVERLRDEMQQNRMDNGLTLTAILWCMAHGIISNY